ncbi:MAG: carbon starvation CstA family protein [Acidobacteriota bacterium]
MNVAIPLLSAFVAFLIASRYHVRSIARQLGVDDSKPTPAVSINDGRDYVPTRVHVLFAHHFSAIAGAGPIVGPTLALLYGVIPSWMWIVFGGIFIGAVHDFSALFASIRENGKSMAEIARKSMGKGGFTLFILFTLTLIVLVTAAFLNLTAVSLTSKWPLMKLGLHSGQKLLRTEVENGVEMGVIGGIASTSVIIITLFSPILGYLIYKKGIRTLMAYILAACVCAASVCLGILFPVSLDAKVWMILLSIYVLFAAAAPVWFILQPRDFINVQILYLGVTVLILAVFIGGLAGVKISAPAFNNGEETSRLGMLWPMLFITIACGAISGFHSMVATGTTAKQCAREEDIKKLGYNAMLLESLLAVGVVLVLGSFLSFSDYKAIVWPDDPSLKPNPVLAFSLAIGNALHSGFHLPTALGAVFGILLVEGFVITTLDAAIRLNRYLFEELWVILFKSPGIFLRSFWFNSGLSVLFMWVLAQGNTVNALWPIFGTGNQLLAALALAVVSIWLIKQGRKASFALLPALFMLFTTMASLVILFRDYWKQENFTLLSADIVLFFLAVSAVFLVLKTARLLTNSKI